MSDKKRSTEDQPQQQQHPFTNTSRNPTNENQTQETPQSQSSSSSAPSLASRIQSSASGLARNAFTSGPTADAQLLASGSNSKAGGASSSSSSALSAAQQYRQETSSPAGSSAFHDPSTATIGGASFRSSSTEQPASSARGGFELPPLTADEFQHAPIEDPFAQTTGKGKSPATATPTTIPTQHWTQGQAEPDGAAVLSLLNSPAFDPEFPAAANEPFEPVETDLAPPTQLTTAEIQMLDTFRRQLNLPDEPAHQQQHPHRLTSFSLVPDIASVLDSAPSTTSTDATALRDDVLTRLPGAAEWIAVEERYHDEVWGYLRPALEAAAKEMDEKGDNITGSENEEGPAVRRLKMILKHMQK